MRYAALVLLAFVLGASSPANNEAIGKWLPQPVQGGADTDFWARGEATRVRQRDAFVYLGRSGGGSFRGDLPANGTRFAYGPAGPVKGSVVYDPRLSVAFFGEGCCSYFQSVAAGGVRAPSATVVRADLSKLRTRRGIRLGDSVERVRSIYGAAPLRSVPRHPEVVVLAYSTRRDPNDKYPPRTNAWCGQDEYFYFKAGRLAYIQLMNGC